MNRAVEYAATRFIPYYTITAGGSLRANCPFCGSKRAFSMSTSSGGFKCYSCELKGFLPQFFYYMGCARSEVDAIFEHFPKLRPTRQPKGFDQEGYSILPEYILGAYDWCSLTMIRLGFSPKFLKENDVGYDNRNRRITFPIRDEFGNLIGVSGRADREGMLPKYEVYVEAFKHVVGSYKPTIRNFLYNFHAIDLESDEPLFLQEGYKGTLWFKMLGFEAAGLQSYALSAQQEKTLRKTRKKIYVLLDNEPGKQLEPTKKYKEWNALRIILKLEQWMDVYYVEYPEGSPEGTSPDDLTKDQIENLTVVPSHIFIMKLKMENNYHVSKSKQQQLQTRRNAKTKEARSKQLRSRNKTGFAKRAKKK